MLILPKSSSRLMFHSLIGGFKSNDAAKVRIFFFFQSPAFFSMVREWPLFKDFSLYKDFCVKLYKEHFVSGVSGCKSSLPETKNGVRLLDGRDMGDHCPNNSKEKGKYDENKTKRSYDDDDDDGAVGDDDVDDVDLPHPPQRGPGMAGGATGATVPPTAALAAAFCFSIVQSKV